MGAGDPETVALIRNPSIDEDLLEALYRRTDIFAQMPEERWWQLVSLSSENERLVTEEHYEDSPDLGFMGIQDAIFALLEIAPVNMRWLWVLYDLLDNLAPQQVATPEKIDHVLARWATLDDRMSDGKVIEGYHTSLSIKDEFRCLVAALYGRGFVKGTFVIHGSPTPKDVALRCAYYGKGNITAKEMTCARDTSVLRLVLWLADLDVHAFLGDLAGDTWKVDLSDRLSPLVV